MLLQTHRRFAGLLVPPIGCLNCFWNNRNGFPIAAACSFSGLTTGGSIGKLGYLRKHEVELVIVQRCVADDFCASHRLVRRCHCLRYFRRAIISRTRATIPRPLNSRSVTTETAINPPIGLRATHRTTTTIIRASARVPGLCCKCFSPQAWLLERFDTYRPASSY